MHVEITIHSDPGHAWGEISLGDLPLKVRKTISPYSFKRRNSLFLEQDCDLEKAVAFYKESGVTFSVRYVNYSNDCPIRGYARCNYNN